MTVIEGKTMSFLFASDIITCAVLIACLSHDDSYDSHGSVIINIGPHRSRKTSVDPLGRHLVQPDSLKAFEM